MFFQNHNRNVLPTGLLLAVVFAFASERRAAADASFADVIASVQPKIVKIYGAGGVKRLEAYQSGLLISADGHVLTVWSYVLDTDDIGVTLDDGRKFTAQLVGADPRLDIAVLKIEGQGLSHFELRDVPQMDSGARVLAFSNLFGIATGDEAASVMQGWLSSTTPLAARSGRFEIPYQGPVHIVDAITNNPGAAGGALTDRRGELIGLLGKELRNQLNNVWLNYAIPVEHLAASVNDILAGKQMRRPEEQDRTAEEPLSLAALGIILVPNVLERTPPFIDAIQPKSPAATAGLRPDDLIVFLDDKLIQSCRNLRQALSYIEMDQSIKLTVTRGKQLLHVDLQTSGNE